MSTIESTCEVGIREIKEHIITCVRNRDKKIEDWLKEYKKTLCCPECGETHPACLEFHHLNPQDKRLTIGRQERRISMKALKDEIAKCRILCANCHRKEHWNQRNKGSLNKEARQGFQLTLPFQRSEGYRD